MKCGCGVQLFKKDIVEEKINYVRQRGIAVSDLNYILGFPVHTKYRCPKCFKTKKVKI